MSGSFRMAPLDMVEYIYFIEDDKSPGAGTKALYQANEKEFPSITPSTFEPGDLIIPSVIPSFTRRPTPIPSTTPGDSTDSTGRVSIQDKIWSMAGTCVNWWRHPASLLTSLVSTTTIDAADNQKDSSKDIIEDITQGNEQLNFKFSLGQGAENPIQPVLKEAMETPVEARAQLRRHSDYFCPIKSELEKDKGLSVILTDQFVPIAYI